MGAEPVVPGVEHPAVEVDAHAVAEAESHRHGPCAVGGDRNGGDDRIACTPVPREPRQVGDATLLDAERVPGHLLRQLWQVRDASHQRLGERCGHAPAAHDGGGRGVRDGGNGSGTREDAHLTGALRTAEPRNDLHRAVAVHVQFGAGARHHDPDVHPAVVRPPRRALPGGAGVDLPGVQAVQHWRVLGGMGAARSGREWGNRDTVAALRRPYGCARNPTHWCRNRRCGARARRRCRHIGSRRRPASQ